MQFECRLKNGIRKNVRKSSFSQGQRIYHHELHQKHIRKSSILQLQTDNGLLEGHTACSEYLEGLVEELLLHPATRDPVAEETLLAEVPRVFTALEN